MESLPVELLIQIFSSFCIHCQNPETFPNADLGSVRREKRFLAHLCRTSKAICVVAQPILFHYYATGNSRTMMRIQEGRKRVRGFPNELDFLPQFLRSVTQRPDLASQIATMHIVHRDALTGYETQMRNIESLFEYSASKNLLKKPQLPNDWLEGHFSELQISQRGQLHMWLATLAIVLAPRLKSLLLAIDHGARFSALEDSPHLKLPSLHTLGVTGHVTDYHFNELEALYAAAPNLETFYACDASGWISKSFYHGYAYNLALSNLKKLSISDLTFDNLKHLLPCVPKLEDLEYYWDDLDAEKDFDFGDMGELLEPLKKTLKKLCIGFLPPQYSYDSDPFPKWVLPPQTDYPSVRTFRQFNRLEYLSIDCFLLYGPGEPDEPNRLIDILPRSIRTLRIAHVFKGIEKCLRQLAVDAPEKFPHLEEVKIGIPDKTDPRYDYNIDKTRFSREYFEASGIRFVCKTDLVGQHPRTTIPGDTFGWSQMPVPRISDEIDIEEIKGLNILRKEYLLD
ncbi:hypothetical protein F4781DRAFT_145955 [Annulohypoxylon bovei var. microspora]|nr:hypothetical protein F4781DRAFT_145955 [Annulohypoxylon bovei var. microspora]